MKSLLLLLLILISSQSFAQMGKEMNVNLGDFVFKTTYDTANYETTYNLEKNGKLVFTSKTEFWIDTLMYFDVNNSGTNTLFISEYSGGAHCCYFLLAGEITDNKIKIFDTLYTGNAYFEFKDLNNDGKYEIQTNYDGIAYAFTNYAETRFPLLIYKWNGSKFENITKDYPSMVMAEINIFMPEIDEIKKAPDFKCPIGNEDTFNTLAGSLKTVLTAIAYSYMTIGEMSKGIDLINKTYNCPDKQKFLTELNEYYKIK